MSGVLGATITILVIDDDRRYRDLVQMNLQRQGYRVILAQDGLGGLNAAERERPKLVILDLMLPDLDGYEVCRRLREYSDVSIIMLTAKAEEVHKVRGLRLGADDYVTKPFGAEELIARVEAVLRRSRVADQNDNTQTAFRCGALEIDFQQARVTVGGQEVHLAPQEYKLLYHLAQHAGRVIVQDELLRRVWGIGFEHDTELLHTNVRRLRRKIEPDPALPRYVLTRRSIGYMLAAEGSSPSDDG
ncbi:MAG TPA: response regulator transcription factor [Chloroflexota bacterium]|jgi:DNA-binding response OmpR family regulator|nr:response regulator transcription factor [Chloroflexota bacterium]